MNELNCEGKKTKSKTEAKVLLVCQLAAFGRYYTFACTPVHVTCHSSEPNVDIGRVLAKLLLFRSEAIAVPPLHSKGGRGSFRYYVRSAHPTFGGPNPAEMNGQVDSESNGTRSGDGRVLRPVRLV